MKLYYQVRSESGVIGQGEIEPPFQIGRQNKEELDLPPVCISMRGPTRRLIVFRVTHDMISRRAIDIDVEGEQITVNLLLPPHLCEVRLGKTMQLATEPRSRAEREVVCLFNNGYSVHVSFVPFATENNREAEYLSLAQMKTQLTTVARPHSLSDLSPDAQSEAVQLIKSSLRLYNEVPGTPRFFASVAATVRSLIDVDRVLVLRPEDGKWSSSYQGAPTIAIDQVTGQPVRNFSRTLIDRVLQSTETQILEPSGQSSASLIHLERAVASPIFDGSRNVIAVLYADKHVGADLNAPISLLQASLIDVVAQAISTALLRKRDDEFRTTTGQFFSKAVLERLHNNRDLLEGRDADVSILFCDIRGFSRIAHQVGPTETIHWINDVLTTLSECILTHDGVVVDYWGDAVMAMFGAPETQPDHAVRACRTACLMLSQITMLNQKHQALTKGQFNLGIGINSGIARVGNTGSSIKFKYGPLGNTVNVASRVESITKKFGVTCLISQATQLYLQAEFCSRRIARILVQGIPEPVDIHQLMESNCLDATELCQQYELALREFEAENITDSISLLGGLIKRWPNDLPSKLLLQRCTERLTSSEPFDPIWIMDQK